MAEQIRDRLAAAIKQLRPVYRRVFVMAILQGRSRQEIAAAVGASEKDIDERMRMAIKACRARLGADGMKLTDFINLAIALQFACLLGVR